jgi:hypothetical protein
VFALGGILYFILYGVAPNRRQGARDEVLGAFEPKRRGKLRQGLFPRGQRVRKELQESVEALEAISLKALAVEQGDRYPTVEQLIVELNEWLADTAGSPGASTGGAAASTPKAAPNQPRRWWQRWFW